MNNKPGLLFGAVILLILLVGCFILNGQVFYPIVDREEKIPADIAKRGPATDHYPPSLHADEYFEPVPLPYPVNTAGAEDSPFILPDGETLYFFFTPDVRVPPEEQVLDDVSGVYVTYKSEGEWSIPHRVWLQEPGKLSLDGGVFVRDQEMWFCSAREGFTGVNMFTAERVGGSWVNRQYTGDLLNKVYEIGEVHLHGDDLYFHSERSGGKGGYDIWVTTKEKGMWITPVNVAVVNTAAAESLPFVSSDGTELWFTRTYMGTPAIFRSVKENGNWGEPELIISQFAGEPTLDDTGNLYFVHHFYEYGVMIEADIYVAYRK